LKFTKSQEVRKFANALIGIFQEKLGHVGEGNIAYLFTEEQIVEAGKVKAGYACIPQVQNRQRKFYEWAVEKAIGYSPDALIVIDKEIWGMLTDVQKAALVYHELRHLKHSTTGAGKPKYNSETGNPIYQIEGHDVEEFNDVIEHFGAWEGGLVNMKGLLDAEPDKEKVEAVLKAVGK